MDDGTTTIKKEQIKLALKVTHILDQLNIIWTINGKTLQGSNKDGAALPDDDGPIDLVIYNPILQHQHIRDDKIKLLKVYLNQINNLLQEPYESRIIPSAGYIMEVFDPGYGKSVSNSVWYMVSCKMTLLIHETSETLQLQSIPFDNTVHASDYLPLSLQEYEGCIYQVPNKPSRYLDSIKNYLSTSNKPKPKPKLNIISQR